MSDEDRNNEHPTPPPPPPPSDSIEAADSITAPKDEPRPELSIADWPDRDGRYGPGGEYGGVYVPETLVGALRELDETFAKVYNDRDFWDRLSGLHRTFTGRPTPLMKAEGLTRNARDRNGVKDRGATIWLKREDLAHTGAHKINNALGQCLLARKMGKRRVIAETGAGQHGVATATAAAALGLACDVHMGAEDARRQHLNVVRMKMLGARVLVTNSGTRTLRDATNEAMRDWMASSDHAHYAIGSVVGPHPFPVIVRIFQSIIGRETKAQALRNFGALPDAIIACVGGGSNAAGIFHPFIEDETVRLFGVEAGGEGGKDARPGTHAATLTHGRPGVLHGSRTYTIHDDDGQTLPTHSVSAGLDYPGVGPEHAAWKDASRVTYSSVSDQLALDACLLCARIEGIIPALETAHAIADALRIAADMPRDANLVLCCSGRGDKDVEEIDRLVGEQIQPNQPRKRVSRDKKRKKPDQPLGDTPHQN